MAFLRHFPGHTSSSLASRTRASEPEQRRDVLVPTSSSHVVRSETRYFARLTPNATWRSEYLLRTRYLRSLARGKPGTASGAAWGGGPRQGKKPAAVLTFNSRLPWRATSLHAAFANGTRPPRVIQGSGDFGMATIGDPTTGKIEKWGVEDMFFAAQLEDVTPGLVPYALGAGPLAVPNVVDVSQCYGMISGEGFPGGRSYFRGVNEPRGRCLNAGTAAADTDEATIPRIPEGLDAICSVWIAKSPTVVSTTHSMCGMLTGSSLGVITAYSLGNGSAGARQSSGEVTARWVPCPGVPIVSLRVDDGYCQTRKSPGRVWAVALNALGEVFYLTQVPVGKYVRATGQEAMRNAWHAGRTACWQLLEDTRRVAKGAAEQADDDDFLREPSPQYSPIELGLGDEQLVAEAREMDKFLRVMPLQFCNAFEGWDMQRRLEVDFAGDDAKGAGEGVFVIDCGLAEASPARIRRYTRSSSTQPKPPRSSVPITAPPTPSLFGGIGPQASTSTSQAAVEPQSPRSPPPTPKFSVPPHAWVSRTLDLHGYDDSVISAVALDTSTTCLLTLADEASYAADHGSRLTSPWADAAIREVPGRRARFLVAGTHDGAVLVWNARDEASKGTSPVQPLRVIRTDSPRITCVAASALYVVHGGSDGLVQAWDPLASTKDPVRTICAKSHARAPRLIVPPNPRFHESHLSSVGAIYLDPNPTILQGIVAFGVSLRSWSYGSSGRLMTRHKGTAGRTSEAEGRISRRQAGLFTGHIAAEEAELRREEAQRAGERKQLMKRFGALGDLTQEEALAYAQMISEEEFARQTATEDTSSGRSSASSGSEAGPSEARGGGDDDDDEEYEEQMQQAIRLSLMESAGGERSEVEDWRYDFKASSGPDEDLMLALRMSMQDQEEERAESDTGAEEFPCLPDGGGKGKGVSRW